MGDPPRVTVSSEGGEESVRVHDDSGTVETDDAAFSFSVDGLSSADGSDDESAGAGDGTDGDADPRRICAADAVPADGTLRCEARSGRRGVEFILHRRGDAVVAWRNSCPHEPEVPLDTGGGAIVRRDSIVCHKHGAQFERDDGVCTHGPCAGDALDSIRVAVEDDAVVLTDERFESARRLD
ncbi:Rieske (2Fe-2S) protein [Halomicrobium urmianum]|uniref:Rieske (2Fe-2S) protein n=1 Tax=Halomicrobium urmianum TaxID=1586233 RepID=UPI001CD92F5B|nr:Rieske 2Fe-2S domain-containing protein [Halomicrobium urmianum]